MKSQLETANVADIIGMIGVAGIAFEHWISGLLVFAFAVLISKQDQKKESADAKSL